MKILHIANDYRDNNLYNHMFSHLSKDSLEQVIFIPFKKELKLSRVENYEIFHTQSYNDLDRILFGRKSLKIYNDLLKQSFDLRSIDLVHAHTLFSNGIIAYFLNLRHRVDYVVTVRNTDIEMFFSKMKWLKGIGEKILLNAKAIVFVTPNLKIKTMKKIDENIRLTIQNKSYILPNGIDSFWLTNGSDNVISGDKLNIIQVGWIKPNKNQLNSLKAILLMKNEGWKPRLVIAGGIEYKKDEKYYKKLKNFVKKNQLEDEVKFSGQLNKEQLAKEYSKANVFLLPSYKETFGLVYIEALSQALPIVYSKDTGVDGFFNKEKVGSSVNPKDPRSIYHGLINCIENLNLYSNNTKSYIKQFEWGIITKKIEEIYKH